ncbi:quinone-dependent dihydroorotate dehydrogenase [Sphingomonas sp. 1P06PA]|uniref:quinone-dependent dihydroorotate dehydrogenase n=1 Tax=Sphingomonas sp. 1P06PA TaxID=554121 RepID=UPI0039A6DAC1
MHLFSAVRPLLFALDAERAHGLTISLLALKRGAAPADDAILATRVAGIDFANPIGLAAGADKDGRAIGGFLGLGFGAVEIGTLTPLPQAGNPRPRLFRLPADRAVINRMGFNNGGLAAALDRVRATRGSVGAGVIGINVGANKDSADRIADYAKGVAAAAPLADYVTINISSPNTPGLRDLQHGAALAELLAACAAVRGSTPLFLKVAPDLDHAAIDAIARAAIEGGVAALIVSNTTVSRPPLISPAATEAGGLSGGPLKDLALQRLRDFRAATGAGLPLVAAGGIGSADDAYDRIRAGASLVQLYSALVYEGPGLARRIARGLAQRLRREGFGSVAEAVG